MKKSLVSTLTIALVVGAASTTFAAANPFSDVPADHWAYDSIAKLAAEGVVDGYGDGTYRGEQEITRYEMAQMVARAMAKNAKSADLDKLAAEFADELDSLGVRVAALEKKVDNVKWQGELKYEYSNNRIKGEPKETENKLILRLEPEMTVNKNWTIKARMDYEGNTKTSEDVNTVKVDRMWAEGEYGKFTVKLGKIQYDSSFDGGMMWDGRVTGAQVFYNGGNVNAAVSAGRVNLSDIDEDAFGAGNTTNYMGIEVFGDQEKKLTWGVGYHHIKGFDKNEKAKIIEGGLGYNFTDKLVLSGAYARNTGNKNEEKKERDAYTVELKYRGAEQDKAGSYGVWAAYRKLGKYAVIAPTYDGAQRGYHGFEVGTEVALGKNIVGNLIYFQGNANKSGDPKLNRIFGSVEFFF
ncbi:MAG: S-layer homology domain-containing protein [Schwartzia sp.]|nr:S-layer homology domain-containing protein [Schwartzia sp. (in: firmicutes)]